MARRLALAAGLLGASGFGGAQAADAPPVVPPQWTAKLVYSAHLIGMDFKDGQGTMWYDRVGQRYRLTFDVGVDTFKQGDWQRQDQLFMNVSGGRSHFTAGVDASSVCMPFKMPYFDMFGWLPHAVKNGSKTVGAKHCDIWEHTGFEQFFMGKSNVTQRACIGADGVPLEFTKQMTGGAKVQGYQEFHISDAVVGDPGEAAFTESKACNEYPAPPCDADTGVASLRLYRIFGPPEPDVLENRNTGDALGDLSFVCTQGSGAAYRSKLITMWSVDVRKDYGQYSLCNYNGTDNVCQGTPAMLKLVGRRGSQLQGHAERGGQCTPNADIGSQYSFPAPGQCPPGVAPSASHGCSWGNARALRTVEAKCVLEERGLLEACGGELGHAPFLESKRIFEAAFASADPALGGCPDAAPRAGGAAVAELVAEGAAPRLRIPARSAAPQGGAGSREGMKNLLTLVV